jgi:8-oxo-dGTP pyrophosphatase MutT (NUDIX family)
MEKFTKVQNKPVVKEQPSTKYSGSRVKVHKYKEWDIIEEVDTIAVLPYFPQEGYIFLRSEYIPTYQWVYQKKYPQATNFLTCICGGINEGETPTQALRRELFEESGLVLSNLKEIEFETPVHIHKGHLNRYFPCLLELNYNDFQQTMSPGDGSRTEKLSKTIPVSLGDLDQLIIHDLITQYLILRLKQELKWK